MLGRLSSAFRKDQESNNYKILQVQAEELGQLAEVMEDIISSQILETATGESLDHLAALIDLDRNGLSDDDFRNLIATTQLFRPSNGTLSDIKTVVTYYTGVSDEDILILENPDDLPATFALVLEVPNVKEFSVAELIEYIQTAKAAGIRFLDDQIQIILNPTFETHKASLPGYGYSGYGVGGYGHSTFLMSRQLTSEYLYGCTVYGEAVYGDPCEVHTTEAGTLIPLIPGYG